MKSRRTASLRRKAWSSRSKASFDAASGAFAWPLEWPFAVISSVRTGRVGVMLSPFLSSPGHTESQRLFSREYVADDDAELYEFIEARWFSEIKHRGVFLRPVVIGGSVGGGHHDHRNLCIEFR